MYSAKIHYRQLRRQCRDVGVTENQQNILVHTKLLNPHPDLQATSKFLEILLQQYFTVMNIYNHWIKIWKGTMDGKWNGLVNVVAE